MAEAGIDTVTAETLPPVTVRVTPNGASVYDFFQLMKPRVMSLVILTAITGMVLAPGSIHPLMAFIAIFAISVGAGASGALNMWYDADIDAQMQRTTSRPIPRGKISPEDALAFGSFLSFASVLMLGLLVNVAAGALLALTIGFYLFVYTMWLKRRTAQNIVIGGAAGAFPPMIGWAAVTGGVSIESALLFAIIFIWTPPHFWALALLQKNDYAAAKVPMLPVTHGAKTTRFQIFAYSLLVAPLAVAPVLTGLGGLVYGSIAVVGGVFFVFLATRVLMSRAGEGVPADDKRARDLFGFSILYLFALFAAILAERGLA